MTENPTFGFPEQEEPNGELAGTARYEPQQASDDVVDAVGVRADHAEGIDLAAFDPKLEDPAAVAEMVAPHRDIDAKIGTPLLEMQDVTVQFGGLVAVDNVSFVIRRGEILGLIGPNGAGKTTCFNAMTGVYKPSKGQVLFDGEPLGELKRNQITRRGIARTFQNIRLFGEMTALENVVVGTDARHRTSVPGALVRMPRHRREEHDAVERGMALAGVRRGSRGARRRRPATCPTATSAGWRSPGRWPPSPSCSASTSRRRGSTRARSPR